MRWTIKRKLYAGFGVVAIIMACSTAFEHWARGRAEATAQSISKTDNMLYELQYLIAYVRGVTVASRAYIISGNQSDIAGIPAMRKDADEVASRVQAQIAGDPGQMEHFARYLEAVRQRRAFVNAENTARKEQGFDAAKEIFATGDDTRLLNVMEAEFAAMKVTAQMQLDALKVTDERLQLWITRAEFLALGLAMLLLVGLVLTLSRSIVRNVNICVDLVAAMAGRDLSGAEALPATNDELAIAIQAVNRMKQSMAGALLEVARSSTQVSSAGTEIEATAGEISATTHAEYKSIELFASSVAEMNAAVKEVAEHAERASLAADDAVSTATAGRGVVSHTQQAMNRIIDSVRTASTDIATLGKATESIGEVVRIVQDIAGQTNLLALNAAIEAARAGEHGRGFAVVAQEVRQLAERSAQFTKEIAAKIEAVQKEVSHAVQSMEQGEATVSDGVSEFNQMSTALEAIVQRIEAAHQGIATIATAATQQSAATAGMAANIHEITSQVSRTTEQVDQTAMACAELAKLAAGLHALVDTFRLPGELADGTSLAFRGSLVA
jgi:methyl-accepting chemotaxis protein